MSSVCLHEVNKRKIPIGKLWWFWSGKGLSHFAVKKTNGTKDITFERLDKWENEKNVLSRTQKFLSQNLELLMLWFVLCVLSITIHPFNQKTFVECQQCTSMRCTWWKPVYIYRTRKNKSDNTNGFYLSFQKTEVVIVQLGVCEFG